MSLTAYAPEKVASRQAETADPSFIEQQLTLQHKQPAKLSRLQQQGSSLLIDGDTILLEELAPTTSVRPHDAGGVVLGFEVGNGAVAAHDFPVGKVVSAAKHALFHHGYTNALVDHNTWVFVLQPCLLLQVAAALSLGTCCIAQACVAKSPLQGNFAAIEWLLKECCLVDS